MTDFKKLEAAQKEIYFENKLNLIPASLKEIYSAVSGREVLVARELIVDDHVLIGIEYTPEGVATAAYTTDNTGKRIALDRPKSPAKESAPKDLISERLDALAKTLAAGRQSEKSESKTPAEPKKQNMQNLHTIKKIQDNKRQNA